MSDFNPQKTRLVVVREDNDGLLYNAVRDKLIGRLILGSWQAISAKSGKKATKNNIERCPKKNVLVEIPNNWTIPDINPASNILSYKEKLFVPSPSSIKSEKNLWLVISDGRFSTRIDQKHLQKVLARLKSDVVTVNVTPNLQAECEKALSTRQDKFIGFRRLYQDTAQLAIMPEDWPHHLFIKMGVLDKLLQNNTLPVVFSDFIDRCCLNSLTVCGVNIGGEVLDLNTEQGLLDLLATMPGKALENNSDLQKKNLKVADTARLFGKVLFGENVTVGQNTVIVGPAIIGSNVKIARQAVIRNSVVGCNLSIAACQFVQNRILINGVPANGSKTNQRDKTVTKHFGNSHDFDFKAWPKFSYAGCFKRIADIITAFIVLMLFMPVFPIIALLIKFGSPGPVFFKDKRQGRYGRTFNCIKFRTMVVGADKIQHKLRIANEADGPQFKMTDDPRINLIGRFLRETYIDEIPQFINVMLGQMSVVGPRPSPESENTLCPYWRDARLSVRPGITGLWQIWRTRKKGRDFQEWIYYDTKYIENLSLRLDLSICWHTAGKMLAKFAEQF